MATPALGSLCNECKTRLTAAGALKVFMVDVETGFASGAPENMPAGSWLRQYANRVVECHSGSNQAIEFIATDGQACVGYLVDP